MLGRCATIDAFLQLIALLDSGAGEYIKIIAPTQISHLWDISKQRLNLQLFITVVERVKLMQGHSARHHAHMRISAQWRESPALLSIKTIVGHQLVRPGGDSVRMLANIDHLDLLGIVLI
mmetsp:Transcript_15674/g.20951  ORF Transcript_15674/g.20951 Transcript_15674/m.20951 type:complete len:120 (-) Transcript_15674:208-567(-)